MGVDSGLGDSEKGFREETHVLNCFLISRLGVHYFVISICAEAGTKESGK